VWTGCIWLRIGTSDDNEPVSSIKEGGEFLDQLSDHQLLKKDLRVWQVYIVQTHAFTHLALTFISTGGKQFVMLLT
jgi:hypothetical protein